MRISHDDAADSPGLAGLDEGGLWVRSIWCGNDGLILIDENRHYLYQELRRDEPEQVLTPHTPPPPPEPVLSLLERLEIALNEAGIETNIDQRRGTVTADASVLFVISRHELSESGKEYLKKYLDVLADILQSDEYAGSVGRIIIEGHACSIGTPGNNMRLSENRAAAVKEYTLSLYPELAAIMETEGKGSTEPVLDENGREDGAASRRVVFRFDFQTPAA
jgi:outer membrane protein OmpA-like peptidoglycan-associated protein